MFSLNNLNYYLWLTIHWIVDLYKTQQILEPRALNYSHLELSNLAINKLLFVFWFNLEGRLLRLRHAVSCEDSFDLGLIPFPLHPIHVCFHDKCWTTKFDAPMPVMLALITCLVCRIFFVYVFLVVYYFFLGSQSPSFLHLSILDCFLSLVWIKFLVGYIYIFWF